MRILQLIDSLEAGGAERMAVNYANALAKQGASAEEILELFFPGLLKKSE